MKKITIYGQPDYGHLKAERSWGQCVPDCTLKNALRLKSPRILLQISRIFTFIN
jgi:hypothetical protein